MEKDQGVGEKATKKTKHCVTERPTGEDEEQHAPPPFQRLENVGRPETAELSARNDCPAGVVDKLVENNSQQTSDGQSSAVEIQEPKPNRSDCVNDPSNVHHDELSEGRLNNQDFGDVGQSDHTFEESLKESDKESGNGSDDESDNESGLDNNPEPGKLETIPMESVNEEQTVVLPSEEEKGDVSEKYGLNLPGGMTANGMMREQSEELEWILGYEPLTLIQLVYGNEEHLLEYRDYRKLKRMAYSNHSQTVQKLLEIIMDKGESACCEFLCLLTGKLATETYPGLQDMPWYSLTGNRDVTAEDMIQKNRTYLIDILMPDVKYAIQCLFEVEENPLVFAEYWIMMHMSNDNAVIELLDLVMNKGEQICQLFLSLLQEKRLTERFPDLKKMPWIGQKMPSSTETAREGFCFKPGMSSTEKLRINNFKLRTILESDVNFVLQWAVQADLVSWVEYRNLQGMSSRRASVELLDAIIYKGEKTCHSFISLLQNDEITARRPALMALSHFHPIPRKPITNAKAAYEIIRKNKLTLQSILMSDIDKLLKLLLERKLITLDRYRYRYSMYWDPATDLIDKIMSKGESTCDAFLDMLTEEDVEKIFPALKYLYMPRNTTSESDSDESIDGMVEKVKAEVSIDVLGKKSNKRALPHEAGDKERPAKCSKVAWSDVADDEEENKDSASICGQEQSDQDTDRC